MKALYCLAEENFELIYGPKEQAALAELVEVKGLRTPLQLQQDPTPLKDVELLLSGWGGPHIDEVFLSHAPKLQAVFYGAGSVKGIVSDAFWQRGVRIMSAWGANALPVAEYTLAAILMGLKGTYGFQRLLKSSGGDYPRTKIRMRNHFVGAYQSTVGIISLGMIGRRVCELLKPFDVNIIAYDPFVKAETAAALGVKLVSLDEVFEQADVVSLHTPWLPETENMITGAHFEKMKPYAVFINTARGAVVNEKEMVKVLQRRPDLQAVLDVTWPEPPERNSLLLTLDNVFLTPHIAGSMGNECHRHAAYVIEDLKRYLAGEPMRYEVTQAMAAILA